LQEKTEKNRLFNNTYIYYFHIERIFNKNKAINFDIQKKEVILHSNFNG